MIVAAFVVGVLTVLRAYAAFNVPLTPDEAYYWTWSVHPAFGYTDHPPLVAWLIWLGTRLGHGAGFVRLPFVLCEAIAALAVGRAAALAANSARAGAIAALLFALIPQTKLALGEALPDGAFMAAWALALWGAVALDRRPSWRAAAGLGLALAAAVLARDFGWALVAGIGAWSLEHRRAARACGRCSRASAAIVALAYAPFVVLERAARLGELRVHVSHPAAFWGARASIRRRSVSSRTRSCWRADVVGRRCAASRA